MHPRRHPHLAGIPLASGAYVYQARPAEAPTQTTDSQAAAADAVSPREERQADAEPGVPAASHEEKEPATVESAELPAEPPRAGKADAVEPPKGRERYFNQVGF